MDYARTFDMQPDLHVLQEAYLGEAAVRLAAELVPDIVLMDCGDARNRRR